mgnify:CR=1 FL=1
MTNNEPPTYRSVMIHASAVEYRGKALVFLGPSETGKSTISQLLAATLDGARVLADDVIDLDWEVGNGWGVGDARPRLLQESTGIQSTSTALHVCLGAIFRLYQAPYPRLMPLRALETGLYLMKAFAEVGRRQAESLEEKRACFVSLVDVARVVSGYELYCDRSLQTVNIIQQVTTSV